jgi:rare lipoprotein A
MMIKYFVLALVAISSVFMAVPNGAQAHGRPGDLQAEAKVNAESWFGESGKASYYGAAHNGRRSADGSRFDQKALTAAHAWLPFGTRVKVTLASTGRTVIVTITDRLHSAHRIVDLSLASARQLGMIRQGVAEVTLIPG